MGPLRRWSMRFSPRRESRVWMVESGELFSACRLHPPPPLCSSSLSFIQAPAGGGGAGLD